MRSPLHCCDAREHSRTGNLRGQATRRGPASKTRGQSDLTNGGLWIRACSTMSLAHDLSALRSPARLRTAKANARLDSGLSSGLFGTLLRSALLGTMSATSSSSRCSCFGGDVRSGGGCISRGGTGGREVQWSAARMRASPWWRWGRAPDAPTTRLAKRCQSHSASFGTCGFDVDSRGSGTITITIPVHYFGGSFF